MGTSVSQPSPRNTNWRRVFVCHEDGSIPESRVVKEVWRATEKESISTEIKSRVIFDCYKAVRESKNIPDAIQKFQRSIVETKSNSIVAEFARRAIPYAFQSKSNPSGQWANSLFSEITSYIVSRDASGFVGEKFRNTTVGSLVEYKKNISATIIKAMGSPPGEIKTIRQWEKFVDASISKLKSS
ncbi:hypothetical protein [Chryseolinea sp. H1M3-3]|uniref:hypothetical protein n=1 Tax=Chryseolinea sp. H1M3-3 TaxID=3034144 RepID=UPI0023EC461A|nr:hypothetical protein [Chryseolinea sp. H1M3-3]